MWQRLHMYVLVQGRQVFLSCWQYRVQFFLLIWVTKGERSSEFYETLFELEWVRSEEKGAFLEQNISLALFYNVKLKNHQKNLQKLFI